VERQRAAMVAGTLARREEAPPRCSASVPCATEVKGRGGASAMAPHGHHLGHGPAQAWRWRGRAQGGAAEGCGPRHGAPAGCGCSKSTDRVWRPSRGTGHVSSHEEQSAPRAPPPRVAIGALCEFINIFCPLSVEGLPFSCATAHIT